MDVITHYDLLIDEDNDPFYDSPELKEYMNKWDGQIFIDALQLGEDKEVLEIGLGTGRIAVKVAPCCKRLTGIDISPKTIQRAKENLKEYSNIRFINADFSTYEFKEKFDIIYSSLTMMHFKNKKDVIYKIENLLKGKGILCLSIDKNKNEYIDMGNRKVKIYPDTLDNILSVIGETAMSVVKVIETDNAYIMRGMYQARFRRDGYSIEVAAKDFETMKMRFLEKLKKADAARAAGGKAYPKFGEFLQEWLMIKKQTVKASTYKSYCDLTSHNLVERFGDMSVNEITRKVIQEFLFELIDAGKNRTAHKIKQLLNAMFEVIVDDYPGLTNPTKKVVLSHYEVKKGTALSKDEEKTLIEFCKVNPHYQANDAMLVLMYTGMRIGELASITYDDTYITCISEKTRRGRKDIVRKIPISPMLKKIMGMIDFEKVKTANKDTVRDGVKRVFPNRHIHEFRYTFITRSKECGVNPEVVMLWAGHESDSDVKTSRVDRGYTTYSEEYLLAESKKIDYDYA